MLKYKCSRCEFSTSNKYHFIRHLTRKYKCHPKYSNDSIFSIAEYYGLLSEIDKNDLEMTANDLEMTENSILTSKLTAKPSILTAKTSILTAKSSILTAKKHPEIKQNKEKPTFICPMCLVTFTRKNNMKVHMKKSCKGVPKMDPDKVKNNLNQCNRDELLGVIEKLIDKVGNNNNSNNTNNIQQNIVINSFGNEKIDYIKGKFLDRIIKAPYGAIPKLLEQIHFNPHHPENHNIKITNMKGRFANVYKNNTWRIEDKKRVITDMMDKGFDLIEDHHEENKGKLNCYHKKNYNSFRNKFDTHDSKLKKMIEQNIEIEILNHSQSNRDRK